MTGVLIRRGDEDRKNVQKKDHVKMWEKMAIYKPRSRSAATVIFPVSRTVRNKCLLFKPPNLWHFIVAARAN